LAAAGGVEDEDPEEWADMKVETVRLGFPSNRELEAQFLVFQFFWFSKSTGDTLLIEGLADIPRASTRLPALFRPVPPSL
jgi:hypothetical protein